MSGQPEVLNQVNGYDVVKLRARREEIRRDPSLTERNPVLVGRWVGVNRARVEMGDAVSHIGGDGELNAMQTVLAALAACDIELITFQAALMGIAIEDLSIEIRGHFNVRALWGFDDGPAPGYDRIAYTVRLRAPGASPSDLALLQERCERASPVGDTLGRRVDLSLEFTGTP